MLTFLHIENVALIKQLDLDLNKGFTVLTGETGSGKSMIIDAINMVLGQRPPKDIIRNQENECYIYAIFDYLSENTQKELSELGLPPDEEGTLMLSRRYNVDGKSTFKINNRTVPVSLVKEVASRLVSVNEQHDSYSLLNDSTHVDFLDGFATSNSQEHENVLNEYKKAFSEYLTEKRNYNDFLEMSKDKDNKIEFLKYQKNEISAAKIKVGEEAELLKNREIVKNSELVSNAIKGTLSLLSGGVKPGAYDKVSSSADNIEKIQDIIPQGKEIHEKLISITEQIEDVIRDVSAIDIGISEDPTSELDRIESRLDLISRIENKYGETEQDVIDYFEKISKEISDIEQFDFTLQEYEESLRKTQANVIKCGKELGRKREESGKKLSTLVNGELAFLDMEKVEFKVEFEALSEPTGKGIDNPTFYIRTNPGEPFKSLSTVSSGGELSRIMLALKTILSGCDKIDTVIFDEIDTGVSGKTSSKIGISLKNLSKSCQVICVTHSAQVSAIAQNHFKIYKEETGGRTFTHVTKLSGDDRVTEIARILGGVTITDSVINSAKELIQQGINN